MKTANAKLSAVIVLASLVGCNEFIQNELQAEVDRIWANPTRKAETEDQLERKLAQELDEKLVGESFEIPGPNPYLHHIKSVRLGLGSESPGITIPGTPKLTQTATHYYLTFSWKADWKKGNGAWLDMPLDMRSRKWWLANEYPDHTVKIRDIAATAHGDAVVMLPKGGKRATASLTVKGSTLDLTAKAKGWFWTVDISKEIKRQIDAKVLRTVVGKSIERSFNANIPGI